MVQVVVFNEVGETILRYRSSFAFLKVLTVPRGRSNLTRLLGHLETGKPFYYHQRNHAQEKIV